MPVATMYEAFKRQQQSVGSTSVAISTHRFTPYNAQSIERTTIHDNSGMTILNSNTMQVTTRTTSRAISKSNSRFYSESHSKANSKHVTSSKKYRRSRFGPKTSAVQRSCPDVTFKQREFSTGWRSRASDRGNINSRNARRRCNKKSSLKYFATECQEKEAIGGRSGPGRGRGEDSRPGREDLGEANNGCKKSAVGQVEQVDPIERPSLERKLGSSVCGSNRSGPICPPYVFKAPVSDDGEAGNGDKSVINNGDKSVINNGYLVESHLTDMVFARFFFFFFFFSTSPTSQEGMSKM